MRTFAILAASVALALLALPAAADSTSPGKNSAFESGTLNPLAASPTSLLTATIAKGKKKRVLAIEATLATDTGGNGTLEMVPVVNGVQAQGQVASVVCDFTQVHCSMSGSWWLDLDAAEAASPGTFKGQPLDVVLEGGVLAGGDPDISATATLSVRVEKK